MEKNIAYHALKDATCSNCCPVCALTDESVRQVMKNFLYEGMTDIEFRTKIKDARGFCQFHADMFLEEGDALAHALVYGDAIRGSLQDLLCDNFAPYDREKDCFFCTYARERQEVFEELCYEALHEEEYLQTYREGGLLCMHHMGAICRRAEKHRQPEEFYLGVAQITVDKYQILLKELDEIQRKNDYRYSGEEWTEGERTAWTRAVAVIHDRVGLPRPPKEKKRRLFGR